MEIVSNPEWLIIIFFDPYGSLKNVSAKIFKSCILGVNQNNYGQPEGGLSSFKDF